MSLPEDTADCDCFPCVVERRSGGDAVVLCVDCKSRGVDRKATHRLGVFNLCFGDYTVRDVARRFREFNETAMGADYRAAVVQREGLRR